MGLPSISGKIVLSTSWRPIIDCHARSQHRVEMRPSSRHRTATLSDESPGSSRSSNQKRSCPTEQGKSSKRTFSEVACVAWSVMTWLLVFAS